MERRGRKERFRAGVGKLREKREGNEKIAVGREGQAEGRRKEG